MCEMGGGIEFQVPSQLTAALISCVTHYDFFSVTGCAKKFGMDLGSKMDVDPEWILIQNGF